MKDQVYRDAANTIVAAGQIPLPVNDTLIQLMKTIMTTEQAEFVQIFRKPLNQGEVRERSNLSDTALDHMLNELMDNGVIIGIPNRKSGIMVYRLQPPIPGLFEYTLMRGEKGEKQKKLAKLFDQMFHELSQLVQENYDMALEAFQSIPALTRVIPVEEQVDPEFDNIMPYEDVKKVIDQFESIAVSYCYCRHEKDLLGKPCKTTDQRKNCLLFGRVARFVVDHHFGEEISKEQAKVIMEEAEKDGLVHKAFHRNSDIDQEEFAVCNCCQCCCGTFELFYLGGAPTATYSAYVATVDEENCIACEECVDRCPMGAIELIDDMACIDKERCIGCGVCAYHCSTEAIILERTGERRVFVPPPRLASEQRS